MRIEMLQSMAGINFSLAPGDIYETSAAEGERLIAAGIARRVAKDKPARRQAAGRARASLETRQQSDSEG